MNKEWSEANKIIQTQLKKEATFQEAISHLINLRESLFHEISRLHKVLKREDFDAIPFINANGYHNKTIAYSIWHVVRIEDIVTHTLIAQDEQIFFQGGYSSRIHAPLITTGNELRKQQIVAFSKALDMDELYQYAKEVKESSDDIIMKLSFSDTKRKVSDIDRERLLSLAVVSEDEHASWLVDYWCGKDIKGLIQMPLSRHWIMHIEACLRIEAKLLEKRK